MSFYVSRRSFSHVHVADLQNLHPHGEELAEVAADEGDDLAAPHAHVQLAQTDADQLSGDALAQRAQRVADAAVWLLQHVLRQRQHAHAGAEQRRQVALENGALAARALTVAVGLGEEVELEGEEDLRDGGGGARRGNEHGVRVVGVAEEGLRETRRRSPREPPSPPPR